MSCLAIREPRGVWRRCVWLGQGMLIRVRQVLRSGQRKRKRECPPKAGMVREAFLEEERFGLGLVRRTVAPVN